ncbi:MAG: rRNA maturation RNase YbeY [Gammaproteobacteria bacterium]|nr:MAG: rRNA maturation RNase YbeY [Gammaproteobacteria bacterium]
MNFSIDLQIDIADSDSLPTIDEINGWCAEIFFYLKKSTQQTDFIKEILAKDCEFSVIIVNREQIKELNSQYRGKDKSTNVLSFPFDYHELPEDIDLAYRLLGDIVICDSVVEEEAREQQKEYKAHWAHIFVHGVLHLCGFDHIDNDEAEIMESIETDIMKNCGFPAPY